MNIQNENQDTAQTAAHNSFPEPQTIPSGWDTSALSSTYMLETLEYVDDLAEDKSN